MKNINSFELFLIEKLHINKGVDILSDEIYSRYKSTGSYIMNDTRSGLFINKIYITISDDIGEDSYGFLDINKSHNTKKGWVIYLYLKSGFYLSTIQHECNHIFQLMNMNKNDILNKLNYIKAGYHSNIKSIDESGEFFYMIYLSSNSEINSIVNESYGLIKEAFGNKKISSDQFISIIKLTRGYNISKTLIDYNIDDNFKNLSKNDINKFFYLFEENKKKLDKINDSKFEFFRKIKLIIAAFKSLNSGNTYSYIDSKKYIPNRGKDYYQKFINNQGDKLKSKLYKLYDHFT